MTAAEIVAELERLGQPSYKKTMSNHGVREPSFGVKIEDMKKIVKRVGKQYELALELYETGIYDAMYLAGLLADESKMTVEDLERWVRKAYCGALNEYAVPWVASESRHGWELGLAWIESQDEDIAAAGWATLSSLAGVREDADLDLDRYQQLLERVATTIHQQPNRVKYVMNGFVIAVGSFIRPLNGLALETAAKVGRVKVDMNGTACKVPSAPEYIQKVEARGSLGRKRKTARC